MNLQVIYEPKGRAREYAALAANLYSGCQHGCIYCYAPAATFKEREMFHYDVKPRPNALPRFRKDCERLSGSGVQVLLSFATDPYQPLDVDYRLTRQAIEIAHQHQLGVQILTKGGSRAMRDFDLLGPADAFATTLTFNNPQDSREWEPKAACPDDRMVAMLAAHRAGIQVWVSLEPVIDPAQTLDLIRQTHSFVDHYKVGTWNYDSRAKKIDWPRFGRNVTALLDQYAKPYYLKADLRARMEAKP